MRRGPAGVRLRPVRVGRLTAIRVRRVRLRRVCRRAVRRRPCRGLLLTGIRRGPGVRRVRLSLPWGRVRRSGRSRRTPGTSRMPPRARRRLRRAGVVARPRRLRRAAPGRRARDRVPRRRPRRVRRPAGTCRRSSSPRWGPTGSRAGLPDRGHRSLRAPRVSRARPFRRVRRIRPAVRLRALCTTPPRCLPTRGAWARALRSLRAPPAYRAHPARRCRLAPRAYLEHRTPPARLSLPAPPVCPVRRALQGARVVLFTTPRRCWPHPPWAPPARLRRRTPPAHPVFRAWLRALPSRCPPAGCLPAPCRRPDSPGPVSRRRTATRSRGSRPSVPGIRPCCATARRTGRSSS
jgi:hypothetical protein